MIRIKHYSRETERAYVGWIRRYILFNEKRHPTEMGEEEIARFLSSLATVRKVSASTQNQALNALLFLYRDVVRKDLTRMEHIVRAKAPKRLPVVLTRTEVRAVLGQLHGGSRLMAALLYGAGLRLMECCRLRVMDVDFPANLVMVRDGKGAKDRATLLPVALKGELARHLNRVRELHDEDLIDGSGWVELPEALGKKHPNAGQEWKWQWVFPATRTYWEPRTRQRRRHHLHETVLQRTVRMAVAQAGISKPATCHTLRHSFAAHMLEDGSKISTVQELMGHRDVSTTMIYTHVVNDGAGSVSSPFDHLLIPKGE